MRPEQTAAPWLVRAARRSARRLWLACALAGPACAGDPPPSDPVALSIVAPSAGATLTETADIAPSVAGVQVRVEARIEGADLPADAIISSSVAGVPSQQTIVVDATGAFAFEAVTLAEGPNTLTVEVARRGAPIASATVDVTLTLTPPAPSLRIETPRDRSTLRPDADQSDDPGYQTNVIAAASNLPLGTDVALEVNGERVTTTTSEATAVRFGLVTVPAGTIELRAAATVDGALVQATSRVTVDVGSCEVTLAPVPRGACDVTHETPDADPAADGLQFPIRVTSECADRRLRWDDEPITSESSAGATTTFLVTAEEGAHVAFGAAQQGDRSGTSTPVTFAVRTEPVSITLTAPTPLTAPDDEAPSTPGIQATLEGSVDAPAGSLLSVYVGERLGASGRVDGTTWRVGPVSFTESGDVTLRAVVDNGCGLTATADAPLTVTLAGDDLRILSPADGAAVGPRFDADAGAPGFQGVARVIGASGIHGNLYVECRREGERAFNRVGSADAGSGDVDVPISAPSGVLTCRPTIVGALEIVGPETTLDVDYTPPAMRVAQPEAGSISNAETTGLIVAVEGARPGELISIDTSFSGAPFVHAQDVGATLVQILRLPEGPGPLVLRATDEMGNAEVLAVDLVIDRTAPVLVPVVPRVGGTVRGTDVRAVGGELRLTAELLTTGAAGGDVCVTVGRRAPRCVSPTEDGALEIPDLVVVPGANTVSISAVDPAGNTVAFTGTFTADVRPPLVRITQPADGFATTSTAPLRVDVDTDVAAGIDVIVAVDGTEIGRPQANVSGDATLLNVSVPPGTHAISATASDARGTTTATSSVTIEAVAPTIALVEPESGAVVNAASDDADALAPGFQVEVRGTTLNTAAGASVRVDVDCGAGVTSSTISIAADRFASMATLPDEAVCVIAAEHVTRAGQRARAQATVQVDRTIPAIAWTSISDGMIVRAGSDASSGLQVAPVVTVTGASAGQRLRFRVNGGPVVESTPLTAGTSTVTGPLLAVPDGFAELTAAVGDDAGNVGEDALWFVAASASAGGFVSTPAAGARLGLAQDAEPGAAGLQTAVRGQVSGAFDGAAARLCVRSSDASTYPILCAEPGARAALERTVAGPLLDFGLATLPEGTGPVAVELIVPGGVIPAPSAPIVTVDTARPVLSRLWCPTDTSGDGVVNRGESAVLGTVGRVQLRALLSGVEDGVTVVFYDAAVELGRAGAATGVATIAASLSEGPHSITVAASDAAGNLATGLDAVLTLRVDTIAPSIAFSAPPAAVLNAADDVSGTEAGLQAELVVTTDAADAAPVSFTTSIEGGTRDLGTSTTAGGTARRTVTLSEGAHVLSAAVADAAGNRGAAIRAVTVDSIAPAAPVLSATLMDTRRGSAIVRWVPTGDGVRYELRTALTAIDGSTWADAAIALVSTAPHALVAGAVEHLVPSTPFQTTRTFAATASDAAGNVSPIGTASVTAGLRTREVAQWPGDAVAAAWLGDVNADGVDDLGVSTGDGAVRVVFGGTFDTLSLVPPSSAAGFGAVVFGVGDADGDDVSDFVVGAPGEGAAYLFLGQSGGAGIAEVPVTRLVGMSGRIGAISTRGSGDLVTQAGEPVGCADVILSSGPRVFAVLGRRSWPAEVVLDESGASFGAGVGVLGIGFSTEAAPAVLPDLDGDGLSELALINAANAKVRIFSGRALADLDGVTPADAEYTVSVALGASAGSVFSAGALRAGGAADVGVLSPSLSRLHVVFGADPPSSAPDASVSLSAAPPVMSGTGAGDLDRDEGDELVVWHGDASRCAAWLVDPGDALGFDMVPLFGYEVRCRLAEGAGDGDGDGVTDIAVVSAGVAGGTTLELLY